MDASLTRIVRRLGVPLVLLTALVGFTACSSDEGDAAPEETTAAADGPSTETTDGDSAGSETSDAPDAEGSEEVDACALITEAEFTDIFGAPATVTTPKPAEPGSETTRLGRCEFENDEYIAKLSIYPTEYWEEQEAEWGPEMFEELAVPGATRSAFMGFDSTAYAQFDGKPWTIVALAANNNGIVMPTEAGQLALAASN